jgi:hypothetical protein
VGLSSEMMLKYEESQVGVICGGSIDMFDLLCFLV